MVAVNELAPEVGIQVACDALGVIRSTFYRQQRPAAVSKPRQAPPRALSAGERETVLAHLHEERFQDRSPAAVQATLLDEGIYRCSTRTMYRILAEHGETGERRDQRIHPVYRKPELLATAPNELWSWDITKLLGPAKWDLLLSVCDSRCVQPLCRRLDDRSSRKRGIGEETHRGNLHQATDPSWATHHSRRSRIFHDVEAGCFSPGRSRRHQTHSRPHVSDDNPYSESQFRTMKYRPDFPDRFGSIEDSRAHSQIFFAWYNEDHRHSGIGLLSPAMVHYGQAHDIFQKRQTVLDAAYLAHPERFVGAPPKPLSIPKEVWINKPIEVSKQTSLN